MFGWISINGIVKWLGVPSFLQNDGPPWADNILWTSLRWGVGGTVENWDLESQHGRLYGSVDVLWHGAVPARPAFLPRIPENASATVRRVLENIFCEHRMVRTQSLLDNRHIGSVSNYLWIAAWSALWIAYGVNQFLGIAYDINLLLGIGVYIIADF